jgi:hypothetical protein
MRPGREMYDHDEMEMKRGPKEVYHAYAGARAWVR